jgi:hypothetical protein
MDSDEFKKSIIDFGSEEIVRICNDGTVRVNPKYTVDEAARAFWEAVVKISVDHKRKAM